ncbi:hypothetical protein CBM2626_U30023 [Cupriavidus taiwanensis]|nr:hypothetical protein CBM2626_U30023 [Cupriavidus taiwanensis]
MRAECLNSAQKSTSIPLYCVYIYPVNIYSFGQTGHLASKTGACREPRTGSCHEIEVRVSR